MKGDRDGDKRVETEAGGGKVEDGWRREARNRADRLEKENLRLKTWLIPDF
jgi:hypothetical protein